MDGFRQSQSGRGSQRFDKKGDVIMNEVEMEEYVARNKSAKKNMRNRLYLNPYPGRGLVLGRNLHGDVVQVYWVMGRSDNSRNRVLVREGQDVFTRPADPKKAGDPSLIIYRAMGFYDGMDGQGHVVSNGDQTDTICDAFDLDLSLVEMLANREYEPDSPNFTPRISGLVFPNPDDQKPLAQISVLKKSKLPGDKRCISCLYTYQDIAPGIGYCVTTYMGNGDPLPSFTSEPFTTIIEGDALRIARFYWQFLNEEHRVSLVVKMIDVKTNKTTVEIINQYPRVG